MEKIKTRNKVSILFLLIFIGFYSCEKEVFYSEERNLNGNWNRSEEVDVQFEINDTTQPYNLFINFINNNNYPYSNVYLFSKFVNPNGEEVKDTLEYILAMPNGDWVANKNGNEYKRQLIFKRQFKFNKTGTYQIKLNHGMRVDSLIGVEKIGMILDKSTANGK